MIRAELRLFLPWIGMFTIWITHSLTAVGFQTSSAIDQLPEYKPKYIDISSGLSNNYVSKIAKDKFGMMWFACEGGLNRYDGTNFKIFRPDKRYRDHLLNENIETIFVDSRAFIWVGTKSGGVSRYSQVDDQFVNFNHAISRDKNIPSIRITDIAEDHAGNIWIATWGMGLFKLSSEKHALEASFLNGKIIQDIEVDDFGNVWATSNNNIHKYDPSEKRLINLDVQIGVGMSLFYDQPSGELLVGSSEGLFSFDIDNYSIKEFSQSIELAFQGINTINVDKKGRIWTGSWSQGLYYSDIERTAFKKYALAPRDKNNTNFEIVLDISIDQNDQIWISTGYGGVVKLSPTNAITHVVNEFGTTINLPDNNIHAIAKDAHGGLWCGTWNGGIGYSSDGHKFQHLPGIDMIKVSAFLEVEEVMWVGTAKGLVSYNTKKPMNGLRQTSLSGKKIKDIYLDSDQRLWVGTQQHGLFLFNYKKDKSLAHGIRFRSNTEKTGDLKSDRISKIVEDGQGNIWIGTYNGLYSFSASDSTFQRQDAIEKGEFPSVIVLSLHASGSNELWVGMPGGLLKTTHTNGRLKVLDIFNLDKGLRNDYITAVCEDSNHNIWISNTSGIASIQRDNGVIINMVEDVDYSYAMNINAYFNDGKLIYFGSSNGFFFFNPLQVDLSSYAPDLIFNTLKVDNKEVTVGEEVNGRTILKQSMSYTKKVEITHKESIVSIGFVPNDYRDRTNLNYHYRVLGLQDNWIDNGSSTEINFIGLERGNYTLEIRSTRDSVHFSAISSMDITVFPPPWLSKWAYMAYSLVILIFIGLISQFFVNRTKLKANLAMTKLSKEKEHELYEAKLRFFTNISHELRTPLTLILSPITEILSETKIKAEWKERLSYVEKNANKLLSLINQLIDFRKADQSELKLRVSAGNFVNFAKEIFLSFKGYAETQGVIYDFHSDVQSLTLTYDKDKMEVVLCNLLSNAFKFTTPNGRITLSLEEEEEYAVIRVRDTGKGISKEYQDKIFNRFFQIQDSDSLEVVGSGIGLSLSKRIAKLHHGNIEVKSGLGKGSEFIVYIPKGQDHFEEALLVDGFKTSEDINAYDMDIAGHLDQTHVDEAESKLLIIDDNSDILSYLKTLFEEVGYQVETAVNGLEGKKLAFEVIPDLIISDVMMPEMDGIELCRCLKDDVRTSHIPIILLTARTSTVHEVDGLDKGADDYVRKPFDSKVIKSRVASQLENRQKVRAHLVNKIRFDSKSIVKPINREERFIQEISELVEKSMHDQYFSIEVLADELCMSQSTLYRKIKSLTGMSIAGFIRSIRLKKATEVLLTEDTKLSAVAYAVGFNDYKYFKKSFIQQYGVSPKEYREKAFDKA